MEDYGADKVAGGHTCKERGGQRVRLGAGFLFGPYLFRVLAAIRAGTVRKNRHLAVRAYGHLYVLEGQMRTASAGLTVCMMFCWYASHVIYGPYYAVS